MNKLIEIVNVLNIDADKMTIEDIEKASMNIIGTIGSCLLVSLNKYLLRSWQGMIYKGVSEFIEQQTRSIRN
jgi:hypothetical protein